MLKKYAGEEFLVLEIPLREKFMIPCKYIYPFLISPTTSELLNFEKWPHVALRNPKFGEEISPVLSSSTIQNRCSHFDRTPL